MKKNSPNSQDRNRNNNKNKNGKDPNSPSFNVSKECAATRCRAADSCTSANKTVQDIERYTREAENLVEALSALTKLAEQLKPCIASKSQCFQKIDCKDESSDISSLEDKYVTQVVEEEEREPEPVPIVKRRKVDEDTKVVSQVRSEPARVRPDAEKENCLCCCRSLTKTTDKLQNQITFDEKKKYKYRDDSDDDSSGCCVKRSSCCVKAKDKDNENEKSGWGLRKEKKRDNDDDRYCCRKRKSKEKQIVEKVPKPSKIINEVIELRPLPMPTMTIVYPVEQRHEILTPTLQWRLADPEQPPPIIEEERLSIYPTVPALTTKAAMNLDDKEIQTGRGALSEMGCNTDAVQFTSGGATKECSTCCQIECGLGGTQDVETPLPANTLNTVPFEEYAEKDFHQYWYEDAVNCKCPPTSEIKPPLISPSPPPNTPTSFIPEQQQFYQNFTPPPPMMNYHANYNRCQPNCQSGSGMQYQNFPNNATRSNELAYTEYTVIDSKGNRQVYNDNVPTGINAVNYAPPEGVVYKACRPKGSATDSQKTELQDIDCVPSCYNIENQNRNYISNTAINSQSANQSEYKQAVNNNNINNKKVVQYQDRREYEYYATQNQPNYKLQQQQKYVNNSVAPCYYENSNQRSVTMGARAQGSSNRNVSGQNEEQSRGAYQRQLSTLMGQNYNTLFVDKADKDLQESIKMTGRPPPGSFNINTGKSGQCSGSCKYQYKDPNKKK